MTSVNVTTTKNTVTVSEGDTRIVTIKTQGPQGPAFADGDIGDIVISGGGTVATIDNGVINNAKIASNAAIAGSKIDTSSFTSNITITNDSPIISLTDSNANSDFQIKVDGGHFDIKDVTNNAGRLNIQSDGTTTISGNLNASSGFDVTGNISVTGTVDGRDVATDGTKLDGIETGATADQTASEILTLLKTVDGAGSGLNADTLDGISSASFLRSDTNATFSGSTLTVNATLLLADSMRIGDDAFIEDYNAANSVRIKGNQDTSKGFIAFGQQTKQLGCDGTSVLTYDGNTVIDSAYTGALANGITATTQSASDNSTKVATTAYTDTAIANLVDSAPGTLNTLNELAAALGDDANFSTTVTNSIATKLPLAGGTLTGDLTISSANPKIFLTDTGDNPDYVIKNNNGTIQINDETNGATRFAINTDGHIDIAGNVDFGNGIDVTGTITATSSISVPDDVSIFTGTGNDLSLKHDGSSSRIRNDTGALVISCGGSANANPVKIQPNEGEEGIVAHHNERVELYFDNSKKLQTQSIGITVTGQVACDELDMADSTGVGNNRIKLGTGDDLQLYHDGTHSYLDNATGNLHIRGNGADDVKIQAKNGEQSIICHHDGATELYFDNSKKFETTSTGASVTGSLGVGSTSPSQKLTIEGSANNVNSEVRIIATGIASGYLGSNSSGFNIGTDTAGITFKTGVTGAGSVGSTGSERLKITSDGHLQIPNDNAELKIGAGQDLKLYHDGTNSAIQNTTGDLYLYAGTNDIYIRAKNDEDSIIAKPNNAVELYYDNNKKLETTSTGVSVTGNIVATGAIDAIGITIGGNTPTLNFNDGNDDPDFRFLVNSNSFILEDTTNSANRLVVNSDGHLQIPNDNQKLQLGASQDLQLYHDGTNSYILDNGAGHLNLKTNGTQIILTKTPHETLAAFNIDGNNELYFDGSKKFETSSTGATLTGKLLFDSSTEQTIKLADNRHIHFGTDVDLKIYHDGSHSYIADLGTGDLRITGSAIHLQNAAQSENMLKTFEDGKVELYFDNSKKLETASAGVIVSGAITSGDYRSPSSSILYLTSGSNWIFRTDTGSTKLTMTNTGEVTFTGSLSIPDAKSIFLGNSNDLSLKHDGTDSRIINNGSELFIYTVGDHDVKILADSQNAVICKPDAAVELYYDNVKKLETTSDGINIEGTAPRISFTDTNHNNFAIIVDGNDFNIQDTTAGENRLNINSTGIVSCNDGLFVPDAKSIFLGNSNDLQLKHDGTDSFIKSTTGHLKIGDANVRIMNAACDEDMIHAKQNEQVELYYDNSKKFETKSNGVEITGNVDISGLLSIDDSQKAVFGDSHDLEIEHDGSHSNIHNVGTGNLHIRGNGTDQIKIQAKSGEQSIVCNSDGAIELYFNGAKMVETTSYGVAFVAEAKFDNNTNAGKDVVWDPANDQLRWLDSTKATFGSGSDVELFHDGGNAHFANTTGTFKIKGNDIHLQNASGGEDYITAEGNGKVELYYDNSKKFETTSTGAFVTGALTVGVGSPLNNNVAHLRLADSSIANPSSQSVLLAENNTNAWITIGSGASSYGGILFGDSGQSDRGQVRFNHDGDVMQLIANEEKLAQFTYEGNAELYYDNAKKLETLTDGVNITGTLKVNNSTIQTGLFNSYARLSDTKSGLTHGGATTAGQTITRTLNTEDFDPDNIVTLSNDVFTLANAGTYFIEFKAPAARVDYSVAYLEKSTDGGSTFTAIQQSVGNRFTQDSGVYSSVNIIGDCRETITQSTQYRLRQYTQRSRDDYGLGLAAGISDVNSIFSVVKIYREN